jgi:hypothetical protein
MNRFRRLLLWLYGKLLKLLHVSTVNDNDLEINLLREGIDF